MNSRIMSRIGCALTALIACGAAPLTHKLSPPAPTTLPESKVRPWPETTKKVKIFTLPEDQTIPLGQMACFTVVATTETDNPLDFQWYKNNQIIPGARHCSLVITNVQVSDVGFYACRLATGKSVTIARSIDESAPGARLFVLVGTNTAISGPVQPGTGNLPPNYYGFVAFKTSTGSRWFTPPAGKTSCVISDMSRQNYVPPYIPVVEAVENGTLKNWRQTNQVSFPIKTVYKYQFTTYIMNPMPPPACGDTISLDITWQP